MRIEGGGGELMPFGVVLIPIAHVARTFYNKKKIGHTWRFQGWDCGLNQKCHFDIFHDKLGIDIAPKHPPPPLPLLLVYIKVSHLYGNQCLTAYMKIYAHQIMKLLVMKVSFQMKIWFRKRTVACLVSFTSLLMWLMVVLVHSGPYIP